MRHIDHTPRHGGATTHRRIDTAFTYRARHLRPHVVAHRAMRGLIQQ